MKSQIKKSPPAKHIHAATLCLHLQILKIRSDIVSKVQLVMEMSKIQMSRLPFNDLQLTSADSGDDLAR